jgi:hypothetical protein
MGASAVRASTHQKNALPFNLRTIGAVFLC